MKTTPYLYYYAPNGQLLGKYQVVSGGFQRSSASVWFGSKLIRQDNKWVMQDRLGSVRANGNGERFNYYPYGQEMAVTGEGRMKFGTYFSDGNGVDYADQRYYANTGGRFMTPDPGGTTMADLKSPGSWNRYAYVQGDPVNFRDTHGLLISAVEGGGEPDDQDPDFLNWAMGSLWYSAFMFGGGGGGGGPDPRPAIDAATNANAHGLLKQRLSGFKVSNCWKVLSHEGVNVQNVLDNYSNENFYDVRTGSQFGNLTLSDIGISSSDKTTLSATLGGSADAKTVGALGSAGTTAVLVGTQYFYSGNTDAIRMNSLFHEMLHALGGFGDPQILNDKYFLRNGLVNKSVGNILDTSGITDWLSRDCKK